MATKKKHQKGYCMQVKGRGRARDREKKITVEHLNQHVRALWMLQKYYFIIPAAAISIASNVFYLMKLFAEHYSEYRRKCWGKKRGKNNLIKIISTGLFVSFSCVGKMRQILHDSNSANCLYWKGAHCE